MLNNSVVPCSTSSQWTYKRPPPPPPLVFYNLKVFITGISLNTLPKLLATFKKVIIEVLYNNKTKHFVAIQVQKQNNM